MLSFLLTLVVLLLIFGLLFWVIDLFPGDPRFKQIAKAILGLFIVIYLIGVLLGQAPRIDFPN
jgi:hypothetical protein